MPDPYDVVATPNLTIRRELGLLGPYSNFSRQSLRAKMDGKGFQFDSKSLFGHFGCVNAIEFSHSGTFLASGGDDKRVLVWNVLNALNEDSEDDVESCHKKAYHVMNGRHNSNIFCIGFNSNLTRVFSGGNDEQVLVHEMGTGKTLDIFLHDEPIYGLDAHPFNPNIFATASSDGRVQLFDMRSPIEEDPVLVAGYCFPFHGVQFNPVEPRLLVTANLKHGIELWDVRRPRRQVLEYGNINGHPESAMAATWNESGDRILGLRRRRPPVLFHVSSPVPQVEFDNEGYFNSCTMKTCAFAGLDDEYVMSGSDDFNLHVWKIPKDIEQEKWMKKADFVLRSHRSIVNQVRFNKQLGLIASSGVEKIVKLWSSFKLPRNEKANFENEASSLEPASQDRRVFTRTEYVRFLIESENELNDDYSVESTKENPRMIAFFDTLVRKELDRDSTSSSSPSSSTSTSSSDSETEGNRELLDPNQASPDRERISAVIARKRSQIMKQRMIRKKRRKIDPAYMATALTKARLVLNSYSSSSSSSTESDNESAEINMETSAGSDKTVLGTSTTDEDVNSTPSEKKYSLPEALRFTPESSDHESFRAQVVSALLPEEQQSDDKHNLPSSSGSNEDKRNSESLSKCDKNAVSNEQFSHQPKSKKDDEND